MTLTPPKQTYQWRARRKSPVTAIAGFNCLGGVVIAADTEETYADNKVYMHKLFSHFHADWRIGLAGAGLGYLIDYAKEKIFAVMRMGLKNDKNLEAHLEHILDQLYEKEFKKFPVESPTSLQMQLIIGAQFRKETDPG